MISIYSIPDQMKKPIENPFIFTKKAPFMQRIADLVRTGHTRYITGDIPIDKAGFFSAKMNFHYGCLNNNKSQFNTRQAGNCSARLLFYYADANPNLKWILLITLGNFLTPDSGHERWISVTEERINITGYELVRYIREGKKDPTWTWRYSKRRETEIRNAILTAIRRHHTDELRQIVDTIWRSPAFHGVREQVKKLESFIKAEWQRTSSGEVPALPKGLGYVRRLPDKGKRLTEILKEFKNANSEES